MSSPQRTPPFIVPNGVAAAGTGEGADTGGAAADVLLGKISRRALEAIVRHSVVSGRAVSMRELEQGAATSAKVSAMEAALVADFEGVCAAPTRGQ